MTKLCKTATALLLTAALLMTGCSGKTPEPDTSANGSSDISGGNSSDINSSDVSGGSQTDPDVSYNSTSDDSGVTIPDEQNRIDTAVNLAKEEYNITLPIIPANEALDLVKLDLPEQINGHSFAIQQLIDDETFIVSLFDREGAGGIDRGSGLYNIKTNEYHALKDLPLDGFCAWNSDYIIYKEYDPDFTMQAKDDSVKLFLYDIAAQKSKLIYTYSFNRETEVYGSHWKNNIILKDNKIYFDDIIGEDEDRRVFLFSYDISTGEIEKLKDDAQHPIVYKDTLLYIKTKDGNWGLESLNGEYSFEMNGHTQSIVSLDGDIFYLDAISSDDEKRETTWGVKNILTNEYILKTTRTISELKGNNSFISFRDWGLNCPPVVYNAEDNNFIVFDNLTDPETVWYFSDDVGVISTTGKKPTIYMFKLKQS